MAGRKASKEKLSIVNLLIMGLLIDRPMGAYEIARIIETQIIGRLIKVSAPAVYKNIKELHQAGYLGVEKKKTGETPDKKVYSVTENGKAYFLKLMEHYSSSVSNYYFDFNVFLINLDKVDKETGLRMLESLHNQFYQLKSWIVNHEQEARAKNIYFPGKAIIKQHRMMIYTLIAWIEEVIEEYRQTENLGKHYW
jgi:DNA-binding PadR family transcriptional regulator